MASVHTERGAKTDDPVDGGHDAGELGPVTISLDAAPRPGDDGFSASFESLGAVAYRVAYRILGTRDEAEDVAQEALIRAFVRWRRIGTYAEAWVAHTAGNLAIDAWRHRRARPHPDEVDTVEAHTGVALRLDLQRLLADLPRRQRQVLVLRYLADQTESATAAALGCSIGSVKRHTHRALQALRTRIAEMPTEEEPDVRPAR